MLPSSYQTVSRHHVLSPSSQTVSRHHVIIDIMGYCCHFNIYSLPSTFESLFTVHSTMANLPSYQQYLIDKKILPTHGRCPCGPPMKISCCPPATFENKPLLCAKEAVCRTVIYPIIPSSTSSTSFQPTLPSEKQLVNSLSLRRSRQKDLQDYSSSDSRSMIIFWILVLMRRTLCVF